MVAHMPWEHENVGSSPITPTFERPWQSGFMHFATNEDYRGSIPLGRSIIFTRKHNIACKGAGFDVLWISSLKGFGLGEGWDSSGLQVKDCTETDKF